MPPNTAQVRIRRRKMYRENPYCHWCNKKLEMKNTTGKDGKLGDDFPTIDHINSRVNGTRPKKGKWVLSCYPCNQSRAREEQIKFNSSNIK